MWITLWKTWKIIKFYFPRFSIRYKDDLEVMLWKENSAQNEDVVCRENGNK